MEFIANTQYMKVVEFMNTFSQEVNSTSKSPSTKVGLLRYSLIEEERDELSEALANDDVVEVADALADLLYVIYGAQATLGLPPTPGSYSHIVSSYKDAKNTRVPTIDRAFGISNKLRDYLEEFMCGMVEGVEYTPKASYSLNKMIFSIYEFANYMNLDIISIFDEVHSSNMSKVCKTREEAEKTIQVKGETDAAYATATIHENNGLFLVKRASDGKVLKGINYFEPNIAKFIK